MKLLRNLVGGSGGLVSKNFMPHIHELIDFTVVAFIVFRNKVLMIHHKQLNMWLPIGGHIELSEDPEQALFREIKEETGLEKTDVEITGKKAPMEVRGKKHLFPPEYLDIHPIKDSHRHIGMIYFVQAKTDNIRLAGTEHHDIRWLTKNDLAAPEYSLQPDVRFYAQKALERFE